MTLTLTVWPILWPPVFGLPLYGRVPPAVQVEHVGRLLQIQAQASGAQGQYHHLVLIAGLESVDDSGALMLGSVASQGDGVELSQGSWPRQPRRKCRWCIGRRPAPCVPARPTALSYP